MKKKKPTKNAENSTLKDLKAIGFFFACLLLFTPLFNFPLYAGEGKSGLQFLRIIQSPKSASMGETGVGFYGNLQDSLSLNPASLSLLRHKEVSFTYNMWVEDISMQQISFSRPTQKMGSFAASLSMLSVKPFESYDNSGNETGKIEIRDLSFQIAHSRRLYGQWSDKRYGLFAGAGVKYAEEKLETVKANTILFDGGLLYMKKLKDSRLGIGLSFMNLGSGLKFDKDRDPSPAVYRLGANYQMRFYGDYLSFSADLKKNSDNKKLMPSYGAELTLKRVLAIRMGYIPNRDVGNGIRLGVGFNLKNIRLDYAIVNYVKFSYAHRIGLSYSFGKPVEITPYLDPRQEKARWKVKRAKKFMKEKLYYEATLEINEALKLDPKTPHAMELMQKISKEVDKIKSN